MDVMEGRGIIANNMRDIGVPRTQLILPPSTGSGWVEYANEPGLYALQVNGEPSVILIQTLHSGAYLVVLEGYPLIEVPTELQSQAVGNTVAYVFRDSLPARNRGVHTKAKEPGVIEEAEVGECT